MTSQSAIRDSGTVSPRKSSSISVWILGGCVSLLTVTAFGMLSFGLVLGLGTLLGLPAIVGNVFIVPIAATAVWIAIWICFRVVEVEKTLALGTTAPDSALHLTKPWVTSVGSSAGQTRS